MQRCATTSTLGVLHHGALGRAALDGAFAWAPLFFSITGKTAVSVHVPQSFPGVRCMDVELLVCRINASSNVAEGKFFPTVLIPSAPQPAVSKDQFFS